MYKKPLNHSTNIMRSCLSITTRFLNRTLTNISKAPIFKPKAHSKHVIHLPDPRPRPPRPSISPPLPQTNTNALHLPHNPTHTQPSPSISHPHPHHRPNNRHLPSHHSPLPRPRLLQQPLLLERVRPSSRLLRQPRLRRNPAHPPLLQHPQSRRQTRCHGHRLLEHRYHNKRERSTRRSS